MKTLLTATILVSLVVPGFAWDPSVKTGSGHAASTAMAKAANSLLEKLSGEQRAKAIFEFGDAERKNWHFIPRERKGLPLKDLSAEQRTLAMELAKTGLSDEG
jgi:hypothetical protein